MKISAVQFNPKIGDFSGNAKRIIELTREAHLLGAQLVVFPELSVCGYPPMDLLQFPSFLQENERAVDQIATSVPTDVFVLVGCALMHQVLGEKPAYNAAVILHGGRRILMQPKTLLPTYDVFDERRYFCPGNTHEVVEIHGVKVGVAICEDLWWEAAGRSGVAYGIDPVAELHKAGVQLLLSPSASPYYHGKKEIRAGIMESIGRQYGMPVVYANQVGGNDGLIFDGASMISDKRGHLSAQAPSFEPATLSTSWKELISDTKSEFQKVQGDYWNDIRQALVLGIKDYVGKCGFKKVHLGLSGGIDSALVAALAVEALGCAQVTGFALPSRYSSQGSLDDAEALASNLGISLLSVPIEGPFQSMLESLNPVLPSGNPGVTQENLQARIRGMILMAWSNNTGSMLLTTGNKSELATGYCTLYGDMAGGLAVIGDLFKTEVYELCRHINRKGEIIPQSTLTKPPSAELRPDQKDEDSLPPYPLLDAILQRYLVEQKTHAQIVAEGYSSEMVSFVLGLTAKAEYKRWQAPPVLKVSPLAFGTGRRHPLARSYFEIP